MSNRTTGPDVMVDFDAQFADLFALDTRYETVDTAAEFARSGLCTDDGCTRDHNCGGR